MAQAVCCFTGNAGLLRIGRESSSIGNSGLWHILVPFQINLEFRRNYSSRLPIGLRSEVQSREVKRSCGEAKGGSANFLSKGD